MRAPSDRVAISVSDIVEANASRFHVPREPRQRSRLAFEVRRSEWSCRGDLRRTVSSRPGLSGTVENVSIRTIRLRAADGSVHIVPFSAVTTITNSSRGAGNAAVSVNVSYKEDTDRAGQLLKDIVAEMRREPEYRQAIRGDLELWGVDKVDGSMASIVGQIRCTDSGRWPVQREFNRRMKRRFQECGIEIASAGQTILMQIPAPADVASNSMPRRAAG